MILAHNTINPQTGKVLRNTPNLIKDAVLQCASMRTNDTADVQNIVDCLTESKTVNELQLVKCCAEAKDENQVPAFSSHNPIGIQKSDGNSKVNEIEKKTAILKIFTHLFAASGVNRKDIGVMKDFLYGKSSSKRFFCWLCQWAYFYETKKNPDSQEIVVAIEQ